MPNIVRQRQRFRQILVEAQHRRHRARDLRHFNGMGQAVSEMVGKPWREYLGLSFQAAKGARMHYAVAVALEGVTVRMRGFRIAPPPAAIHRKAKLAEHGVASYCCGRSA